MVLGDGVAEPPAQVEEHPGGDELGNWPGAPTCHSPSCEAVRGALAQVVTDFRGPNNAAPLIAFVGAILSSSARASPDNPRPSRPPHLRI